MTKHKIVSMVTITGEEIEGELHMKELNCHGKYVMVEVGSNYCSRCGENLLTSD